MKKKILFLFLLTSCINNKNNQIINNIKNNNVDNVININKEIDKNDILFLKTMYFDFNSYELTQNTKKNLDLLVKYLKNNNNKTITLSGYCDNIGTERYNYYLGLKRAKEVKQYLINNEIDEYRITIKSFGKNTERKVIIDINNN